MSAALQTSPALSEAAPRAPETRLPGPSATFRRAVGGYAFAALVSLVFVAGALRLWKTSLEVPFGYGGDHAYYLRLVKNVIDTGWYDRGDRVGQPGGMDLREFPVSDGWLHWLLIKAIAAVRPDPFVALNVFFLLGFPLTTVAMLFICRRLGVSYGPALVVALLYAFLPYHFHRMGHPFLAAYYLVPVSVWLAVRVWQGRLPFRSADGRRWRLFGWPAAGTCLAGVLIGLGGVYYASFTAFFLAVAGAARAGQTRRWTPAMAAGLLVGVILAAQAVSLAPAIAYRFGEPRNPEAPVRDAVEAEVYGLKMIQLVLPAPGHRLPLFAHMAASYGARSPLVNENQSAAMGLIGAAGFVFLLGRLVFLSRKPGSTLDGLSVLCVCGVLLATIGGLGAILAWAAGPWIRGYNRIAVFIACFALLAVALLIQRAYARWAVTPRRRLACLAALPALLGLGLLDQTNNTMIPNYRQLRADWEADRDMVARVEADARPGDFVFTLPYRYFPECGMQPLLTYDLLVPSLHSKKMVFSFGALRGQAGDMWSRWVARMPAEQMVQTLADADAAGVWIDRRGYADHGEAVEEELRCLLGTEPVVSRTGEQAYYDLRPFAEKARAECPEDRKERIRRAILPLYRNGFFPESEFPDAGFGRLCRRSGEMYFVNSLNETRTVRLTMKAEPAAGAESGPLHVRGDLWSEDAPMCVTLRRALQIPPGRHVIRLEGDPPSHRTSANAPAFRVTNVVCEEE